MGQESPSIDFLYDFLYLDKPRAQSWLAQLVADGVPLSTKYQSSSTDSSKVNAAGGIPGVLKGGGSSVESVTETMERSFNTEWSIPLNLLDTLSEANYVSKGLNGAPIGSVIHIHGQANIIDISFMQAGWSAFTDLMLGQVKTTHSNKAAKAAEKTEVAQLGAALKVMPPMPQLYLSTVGGEVAWSVLHEDHMLIDPSALTLTYGANIKGDWHVLAVLDALPDGNDTPGTSIKIGKPISDGLLPVMEAIREAMGRPGDAYAVNPIAIFRAIKPSTR
ncbi:DUF6414 family protein [Bordetella avium]|uniref:DUF6414 family protein n=2 Tax=Bordetella avium TaxID=521 RepID=UPI000E1358BE|nr:hypothetical protein [Bordetella avium]UOK17243.1 hypothetical protein vBBaMIFTN4_51 [Bordetella phage vB_BaM-IFTN4]UOK17318.1 hypothetical protein vBBaMIFTN5_54 [Bordetella phage vB_BaM-IFTN5]WQE34253.1 hypothetical protein U0029_03490 [Bordetella avium]WQE34677.1 hypothetical protein U0029_05920 [Bordetella avium]SUV67846.1 Uncharacterised protein [Bordetella avium]